MARASVAVRSAERHWSLARSYGVRSVLGAALLAGAVGCGANAGGAVQSSGALESQSASDDRYGVTPRGEARAATSSSDARGDNADSSDARGDNAGSDNAGSDNAGSDELVLDSERPITEPPAPAPPPTPVLETTRPVNSTEPVDVIVPPGNCRFVYLGHAVHCGDGAAALIVQADAPDLLSCMRQCLRREGCSAVTDYLYLGPPELGCFLHLSACDDTTVAEEAGEVSGHDFRRVCED
jgi:hypothetical protein